MTLPTLRNNVLIDDAVPRSRCGTEFWLTRNIVGLTNPLPRPMTPIATESDVRPLVASIARQQEGAQAGQRRAEYHQFAVTAGARDQTAADERADEIAGDEGHDDETRTGRAVEFDDLHEYRGEHHHLIGERGADEGDQIRGDHVAVAEMTAGDQRLGFVSFPQHEPDETGDRDDHERDDDLVAPVARLTAPGEQRCRQRGHRRAEQQRAADIEAAVGIGVRWRDAVVQHDHRRTPREGR